MYYKMLSIADIGTDDSMLQWCEYVLTGVCDEISKINKLLDHDYLVSNILKPAISKGREREVNYGYRRKNTENGSHKTNI